MQADEKAPPPPSKPAAPVGRTIKGESHDWPPPEVTRAEVVQRRTGDPRDGLAIGRVVLFKQHATAREFPAIVNRIVDGLTLNVTVQCDITPSGTFLAPEVKYESEVTQEDNPRWRWPNR